MLFCSQHSIMHWWTKTSSKTELYWYNSNEGESKRKTVSETKYADSVQWGSHLQEAVIIWEFYISVFRKRTKSLPDFSRMLLQNWLSINTKSKFTPTCLGNSHKSLFSGMSINSSGVQSWITGDITCCWQKLYRMQMNQCGKILCNNKLWVSQLCRQREVESPVKRGKAAKLAHHHSSFLIFW